MGRAEDGTISEESPFPDSEEVSGCVSTPKITVNDSLFKRLLSKTDLTEPDRALEVKECTNVLGLKVAPLTRPLARRLQTFAVMFWMSYFLLSGLTGLAVCYYLLRYTTLWPLVLAYFTFIYWDFDSYNRGGRQAQPYIGWMVRYTRSLAIWRWYTDFFPIKIVKTAELDPSKNYLLGYHPHGILGSGALSAFTTEGSGFSRIFPGHEPHMLTLEVQFWFPLHRELVYNLGACAASKKGMSALLGGRGEGGKPIATVLVPGGARESLNGERHMIKLVLNSRKGFIKMALRHGVDLVPVFSFGENRVYDLMPNPEGSWLRRVQDWFLTKTGVPLFFFFGRGVFQYSWGILPHRTPIHVVVGRPIPVEKVEEPSCEQVDALHGQYVAALMDLYTQHNPQYGDPAVKLVIT